VPDKSRTSPKSGIQLDNLLIGRFQRVQDVIIDMDIALERGLTWLMHRCRLYDENRLSREQAAKVKVDRSRAASDLLVLAIRSAAACRA
jgi:hypothetical protein